MESLVSIILTNHNGVNLIEECIDSIYQSTYKNFEIIFVDNNSKDNSITFVKKNYPDVKIIKNKEDLGFAGANNIGASHAKGKYLILINLDTFVHKDCIKESVNVANNSNEIGIVASKNYYYYDRELISYGGGKIDKYCKPSNIGENKKDRKIYNVINETFYACGAALLIKKEIYGKIGLFDPYYYAYCEDLDLSWRAWIFGYKVIYNPKSFIYHKIGQVLTNQLSKKFWGEKNLLRTLIKNYSILSIIKILPVYIGRRIGMVIKFLIHFNQSAFYLIYIYFKAFFWNIIFLRSLLEQRKYIQKNRIKDDKFIFELIKKTNY